MSPHKYALLWRDAVTPKETVVMSATFGSSHAISPGGVFQPDSSSPWSDPKPSMATLAGHVAYVLGVKAVERLLTSVQFFASAPPYRKAVVFVNTNRRCINV